MWSGKCRWPLALCATAAVATLVLCGGRTAQARPMLIESWEGSANGWVTSAENPTWSITGTPTSPGVTDGLTSLQLSGSAALTYGQLLDGPSSTSLTALLADATTISVDVYNTDIAQYGFFQQWTMVLNGGGLGYHSLDGFSYSQTGATGEKTLTWSLTPADRATLAANTGVATQIIFQTGSGGSGGSMWLDNLRAEVPEPATASLLALGAAPVIAARRRGRR